MCKELGSVHSILTISKKLNRLSNEKLLLDPREQRTQGKVLPPRLEKGVMAYQTRDSQEETPTGTRARKKIQNGN